MLAVCGGLYIKLCFEVPVFESICHDVSEEKPRLGGGKKLKRRQLSALKGLEVKGIKTTLADKGNSLGVNKQIQRQTC